MGSWWCSKARYCTPGGTSDRINIVGSFLDNTYQLDLIDDVILRALARDRTIDITTTGRVSGKPRRIEIWFHNLAGRLFITGSPGKRSWYANLRANPEFTFHLKMSVKADLPARARPITDEAEKREILGQILPGLGRSGDLEEWVAHSPLVEVNLQENPG